MTFDGHYLDWNQKRIKGIVDFYGYKFLYGKKVLDLGCGYADISGVMHRLGADVTAVDSRPDHLKIVNKKFAGIKTVQADLDHFWPFYANEYDLILDLGLVCHLANYETHLRQVCATTTYLVLETAVCDSDDPYRSDSISEGKGVYDLSHNGLGCRPSAAAIERVLLECGMTFQRMDDDKFNAARYVYNWNCQNNGNTDFYHRRMWFAVKDTSIAQPRLYNVRDAVNIPGAGQIHQSPEYLHVPPPRLTVPSTSPRTLYKPEPHPPLEPRIYPPPHPSHENIPRQPARTPSIIPQIRLFYNYYVDKNSARKQEIDFCLQKNIDNTKFSLIILDSEQPPTYDFFFQKINQLAGPNDISIFCNSDIFFDESIALASKIGYQEVYALTSWDWHRNSIAQLIEKPDNQDAWIVRGNIEGVMGNFQFGAAGSDNRIAYEFQKAGYKVINPCRSIKAYHYHDCGIKNYVEKVLEGNYLHVEPLGL